MNTWQNKLNKALKTAEYIEKGITEKTAGQVEDERVAESVKHYTVYSVVGAKETPIAWRLYREDVQYVIAAARRKLMRAYESIVIGDPLYVPTEFISREE